jgi:hypothetical protein
MCSVRLGQEVEGVEDHIKREELPPIGLPLDILERIRVLILLL